MAGPIWIVVADAARARIFHTDRAMQTLDELADLMHPASRMTTGELVTDERGTRRTGRAPRSGPTEKWTPEFVEAQRFAQELSDWLSERFDDQQFGHLVLVASPSFLGHLRPALDKRVAGTITHEIGKDYTKHPPDRILERVRGQLLTAP